MVQFLAQNLTLLTFEHNYGANFNSIKALFDEINVALNNHGIGAIS